MPNKKNQADLLQLQETVAKSQSIVIANYSGLDVKSQVTLRAKIAEAGGQLKVAKNRLFKIAAGTVVKTGQDQFEGALGGQNAFLFSIDDAVAPIKALFAFAKDNEKLEIKLGILDGKVLSFQETEALSKLPSKAELIGQLISRLNGPAYGLVNVIAGPTRKLVYALEQIRQQKAQA